MIKSLMKLISKKQKTILPQKRSAAHFLLIPELLYSPPNNAIISAYLEQGYKVDVFSPGNIPSVTIYGQDVNTCSVAYSWGWLAKSFFHPKWFKYEWISGTSEDPLAFVGILSFLYGKKCFALVDEIKSDSYRGDRSEQWKNICKWCIRRSKFRIVNDTHRIDLLKDYAKLKDRDTIIVYPGCFKERPRIKESSQQLKVGWGFPNDAFVVGSSGGFNLTSGADWLLDSIRDIKDIYAVIQPLGVSDLSFFLLERLTYDGRLFIQRSRLDWCDAWRNAVGIDVGLCIYTNPSAQFQRMGISSNRLCMFIAMGVPVIATRQESFKFLEEYDCGILVDSFEEFTLAIIQIKERHSIMKSNCETCFQEYINPKMSYQVLLRSIEYY